MHPMSRPTQRTSAVVAALVATLLSTACGGDSATQGALSCPDGVFASVSLGGGEGRGQPMATDVLPWIASQTGVPTADWASDEFSSDRATWVLRDQGQVVAVAEVVRTDLGWRAGTVQSCGPLPAYDVP